MDFWKDNMNITQLLNNNAFQDRNGNIPQWLILHGTAGGTSAQAIAEYFKSTENTNNPVSAHYVIGVEGEVYQCNLESDGAYANGVVTAGHDPWWSDSGNPNPNNVTISIEHCKSDDANAAVLTDAQQAASFALIKDICVRNNIPMRAADENGGITGHFSVDPINRARCPGAFDWNALWQYLNNGGNTMDSVLNHGWTDDNVNKILKAPNGIPVVLGFRDHILADSSWNPDNFPLETEHAANPVEQSNTSLGGGTAQTFRMCRLCYTAQRGVYVSWIGQELQWYAQQNNAQQAEIASLKTQPAMNNLKQINTLAQSIVGLSTIQ